MHKIIYLIVSFSFIACYSLEGEWLTFRKQDFSPPAAAPSRSASRQKQAALRGALFPASIRPGEYVTVVCAFPAENIALDELYARLYDDGGKKLGSAKLFRYPNPTEKTEKKSRAVFAALLAAPSTCSSAAATVKIEDASGVLLEMPFEIRARDFAAEIIPLNPANTSIRTEPDPRKTEESRRLWQIISSTGGDIFMETPFVSPVDAGTRRSSSYGDRRVYRYSNGTSDSSVHAGIDFAVPRGTPVSACGNGRVVLARSRIVTGNSIIIEHLPGVYSLYYHLEKIDVLEGDFVKAGQTIGYSGST
ncbi:MAG: M23 family metallopeptidase, partial [Spirochaetaceae bacterium]|nr:M23 family metallopeptidase [Spirochaetaceae bacterium]